MEPLHEAGNGGGLMTMASDRLRVCLLRLSRMRRRVQGKILLMLCIACLCGTSPIRNPTTQQITLRGREQTLLIYGMRGGDPVIVSGGDGGWVHLAPHVAEVLAGQGFFV